MGNDSWKTVQELKNRTQERSFREQNAAAECAFSWVKKQESSIEDRWTNGVRKEKLDESHRPENVYEIRRWINYCMKKKRCISGKIAGVNFRVDPNNPFKIYFDDDENHKTEIQGEDVFSEAEVISNRLEGSYRGEADENFNFSVIHSVYVINAEEINEYYSIIFLSEISAKEKDKRASLIIQDMLKNNDGFIRGNGREIFRTGIEPNEEIKGLIQNENVLRKQIDSGADVEQEDLPTGSFVNFSKYCRVGVDNEEKPKYGDGIPKAKEFQDKCQYIYSLFVEAYAEIMKAPMPSKQQTTLFEMVNNWKGLSNKEIIGMLTRIARQGMVDDAQQRIIKETEPILEEKINQENEGVK